LLFPSSSLPFPSLPLETKILHRFHKAYQTLTLKKNPNTPSFPFAFLSVTTNPDTEGQRRCAWIRPLSREKEALTARVSAPLRGRSESGLAYPLPPRHFALLSTTILTCTRHYTHNLWLLLWRGESKCCSLQFSMQI
jgi:hypothetical protein